MYSLAQLISNNIKFDLSRCTHLDELAKKWKQVPPEYENFLRTYGGAERVNSKKVKVYAAFPLNKSQLEKWTETNAPELQYVVDTCNGKAKEHIVFVLAYKDEKWVLTAIRKYDPVTQKEGKLQFSL